MPKKVQFKISSALKDIIGKDLITDDYVAVFELVKNSYDAHSSRVDIVFQNIYSDNAKIIIRDNGKGMNEDDIKDKWLFLAYSAKREGTEDKDYRQKIYSSRPLAGAKGIGRFSADRLGKKLRLVTRRKGSKTGILTTDWQEFEKNLKDEFINIDSEYTWKNENEFGIQHGTVIEISELRNNWNRDKMLRLKDSLAKLINPNKDLSENKFEIYIHSDDEIELDKLNDEYYNKVNGKISNFIFEKLELKTTQIFSEITSDGKYVITELKDGGTLIYKIKEKNHLALLHNISYELFYLNQSAKLTFAKKMGVSTTRYGNIFLYKNGFRIYPFGEPGEDPLKINSRYAQGYNRFLGLRNLVGRIEIFGDNPELRETASRGEGLIKSETYIQMVKYFWTVLRRLEKYVIEVQKWGLSIEENLDVEDEKKMKSAIIDLISKLIDSKEVIDVDYGENFLEMFEEAQKESGINIIKNLKEIAAQTNNNKLISLALSAESRMKEILTALQESEKELEETVSQNLFLKAIKSQDLTKVMNFMHHIGISSAIIQSYATGILNKIDANVDIPPVRLKQIVGKIKNENQKILSLSRLSTKANFKLEAKKEPRDLPNFIHEYILNVAQIYFDENISLIVNNNVKEKFIFNFVPLEIIILLDNLLNNSNKAYKDFHFTKKKQIVVSINKEDNNTLSLSFKDNAKGIEEGKLDKIFDYGFTTTQGSGIGLSYVKEIIEKMGGNIKVISNPGQGTEFIITFKKL